MENGAESLYLQLWYNRKELNNYYSSIILFYDLLQLAALLYLTGGIKNPFVIFLIVPAIVSSTLLHLKSTFFLSIVTAGLLGLLTIYHLPLPSPGSLHFHVPDYYLYAVPTSLVIALIFLTYFGARFGTESRKKNNVIEDKVLADSCEALLGSIYLDKGFNIAEKVILDLWSDHIKDSAITQIDAKTKLQELSLKKFKKLPIYKLISNTGPRHKPLFKVAVKLIDTKFYSAEGMSKKDAEQNAAIECLRNIKKL